MRTLALVIISLLHCAVLFGAEQKAQTPEQAKEQLAAAQRAIDEVQAWLERANTLQSAEEKRLQDAAIALSNSSRELKELATQRQRLEGELAELERLIATQTSALSARQKELDDVLRALHRQGEGNLARAFLSGQGPTNAARQLTYLNHLTASQRETLAAYEFALEELNQGRKQIESRKQALVSVETRVAETLKERAAEAQEREAALAALTRTIQTQRGELEQLEMDKAGVQQLIEQLELAMRRIPATAAGTRFASMKGKLSAPVEAPIAARFGVDSNGLSRQGITFNVTLGEPVLAVHSGRVVFADWLRGAGLLVIVDHGDGYMTLYGNNESLEVAAGVSVEAGDVVASAGRSVAREAGLHFEIRKGGVALDPEEWLSK
ncbi:MAG: peptidoglycan DD-metalloendopeptidase family protein [Proteobacteria bacterium]|nr:peptidoglycan DD-metalloendopeptidase family protein [Pseudomonadota bacterium]